MQGGQDAGEQQLAGAVAAVGHRHVRGAGPGDHAPGGRQGADARHDQRLVALRGRVRAGPAEAGHRPEDQAGVGGAEVFVPQSQPFHDARPECLDHHVGSAGHGPRHRSVGLGVQVKDDALLAPGEERVAGLCPELAAAWWLHLHDLGTEVGEGLAGLGARGAGGEVEDAQAGEGSGRRLGSGRGLGGEAVSVHGVLVSSGSDNY